MVAVIAGNGLGLANTSLSQLGQTSGGQAAIGQASSGQYLNLATGNLILQNADEGLIFDGLPLNVLRTYNSLGQATGNQGWLFGFNRHLGAVTGTVNTAGSTITRVADDGSVVTYAFNATLGKYVSQGQAGTADTLAWNASASTWTWTDGTSRVQETYSGSGQLQTLKDPETGASYTFGYDASNELSTITAGDGDKLTLGYTSGALTSLSISEIPPGGTTAVVRQQVSYGYDTQGRLHTVTTTLGSDTDTTTASYTTTYTYDGSSDRVASVTQSDGTSVSYTYAADANGTYRVATITTGSGAAAQTITLGYNLGTDTTTVTDGLGRTWSYSYNAAGQLTKVVAPTVNGANPTTQYLYDASGNLTQVTDADGGITTYTYDANGNRLSAEDPTGHTISYTYNADNQVTSQTTYSVPAQGVAGQSGYVAPGGAQTTYYVYDASDRLNYVVDALGNVTEHDYGTSQGVTVLASSRQYVGVSYSLTGLSPSAPPTLAQLQSWVASSPVQAVLGQMQRTDYSYDVRGQLSQSIQWDVLGSSGQGTQSGDTGAIITQYTYDAQGRLLQQATVRGSSQEKTTYAYDGLGRLVSMTDPLNNVTSYVYTDSGNQLAITQANGLTTTQVRNNAGELVSSTQSASGQTSRVTSYLYDAAGQQVAAIDPAGNVSYTFYDADGRVAGTVDATGAVTAFAYDADGHMVATTQYATLVSTSGWVSAGALTTSHPASLPVPTANASDRTAHTLYDAAGRVIATIDALGDVVATTYDGDGNAIRTTAYATALTSAQLTALGAQPNWSALQADLTTSASDRTSRTIYDADNQPVATIDPAGYVVVSSYDTAGRPTRQVAYATALTSAQVSTLGATPTLAALQADLSTNANDQTTRYYYDDAGRNVAQIDADGYLTTTTVNETTHAATTTRYATALTAAQLSALTGKETVAGLVALLGTSPSSQATMDQYDADGRLHQSTAPDGTVTVYNYNSVGQLLSSVATPASGQGAARTTSATYNAFGDTLTTTDGNGKGTTYTYNALDQRVTATDPLGNTTYTYYDADGRVAYVVQGQPQGGVANKQGAVTAYTYNAFGQVATSRQYAGLLTLATSGSSSGSTLNVSTATTAQLGTAASALANASLDTTTTYTYTLDGQVAGTIDGLGYHTASKYDAFGDLIQQQQQLSAPGSALSTANSTITNYTYDVRGERTGEADGAGTSVARSTSVTYDAFGRITKTTDARGNSTTYTYDGLGRQVSASQTVQGVARTTHATYDAFDRVVTQTDAAGNVTAYQYDLLNHKTTVTTADGVKLVTAYDAYGDTLTVTDAANDITTYTYDGDGNLLTTKDALGNTSTNQYDADGHLTQTTDATGHVVTYSYDASGRVLTRTVDPSGLNLKTTYAYDGIGRQLSVTDPAGSVTTYSYDADGDVLTQVQDAGTGKLNLTTTYSYDGEGKTLTVTVGAGTSAARTTQYVYDNLERLSQQIVDPSGLHLVTSYAYDGNDNLISVTDADGHVARTVYNEANEAVVSIDAAGAVVQTTHDADGRVTSVHAYATPLSSTQLSALGSAPTLAQVQADLTATSADQVSYTAYNAEGQVRYSIDPMGYVTETRYDAEGRVSEVLAYANAVSVSGTLATSLQQGTALGSMASLVSGAGNTDANAHATLHLYDADGQERFTVQQNTVNGQLVGVVAEQRYDAAGRVLVSISYGSTLVLSSSQALSAQLSTSSVTQSLASAPSHVTYSVYDNAGRLRYTVDATNHVTETQYDADGRVTATIAYANAITLPSSQTMANLASAVSATNSGTTGARISKSTYDAAGRVTATADAIGTNASFQYDATGLQTAREDRDGHWTYDSYDKAGRKTLEQSPAVTVGSYNASTGAFQTATQYLYTSYSYDGAGNVTAISQGAGPDSAHITAATTTTYGYDALGHQTSTTYAGTAATHVVYNALGQAVVDQDANGHYQYNVYNTDGELAYSVDADGYVTASTYDAYGNQTSTKRYATALNTGAITGWSAGQPLSLAQVQQGLVASGSDRTLTTSYNQLNQKTQVLQSAIAYDLAMGPMAGTAMAAASPTTTYTYDAYGNLTSTSVLVQGANATGDSNATPAIWATTYTYYDALNRAVMTVSPAGSYTSPQGYVTTTAYDAFGDVTSTTQYATAISTSGITTATKPGVPSAGTQATGYDRTTAYSYDAIGRKLSETDTGEFSDVNGTPGITTGSSVTSYTYDGENRVLTVTVNGMKTTTAYDAAGRVTSVTAPARQVLVSNWQTLLQQSPTLDLTSSSLYTTASPVTSYVYDALGHVLSTNVSAGGQSQQTWSYYNALGQQVEQLDANGNAHYTSYDNNGNITGESYTLTNNGTSVTVTSTYGYDADNQQLTSITQRSGQSGYDSYTQVKYNAFGEVIARGDNKGYEATYTYDNVGNQIAAPDAKSGAVHSYGYDLAGQLIVDATVVTGGGATTFVHNWLDLAGHTVQQRTPSTSAASGVGTPMLLRSYDRWGNVLSYTDAAGNVTQYLYDSHNTLIREIEPNVQVVSATGARTWQTPTKNWYYNVSGQLIGVTDENGNSTWNTYDGAGNLTITQDGAGNKTYTAYDALGRAVAQQTPPANTATGPVAHITYTNYDNLDQAVQQGDFLLNSAGTARTQQAQETYVLNTNGDRTQVTDALGNTSYYTYDSQHRVLTSQTTIQHQNGWQETVAYDANGNKVSDTDANGNTQTWVYDYFGRVTSHVDLSGATTTYTYDASSGLLVKETSNWAPTGQSNPGYLPGILTGSGSEQDYTYYADGQLQQVTQKTGGTTAQWDTYQYDANGNQTVDATYTTDGAGQTVHTETITQYDSHNRLGMVTTENPDNGSLSTRTVYNYDAVGNRRAVFVQSAYGNATAISGNGGAPTTGGVGTQTATPGAAWSSNIAGAFTDNVGFGLTFTATGLPSWLSLNTQGVFSGTPTTAGSWTVAVTATDVNGKSVTTNVVVTVPVAAPVFTAGAANQIGGVGGALSFTVPGATDPNNASLTYSAKLSSGAALPSWLSFNASTHAFTGTPVPGSVGSYSIAVTATAANGGVATETFTLTVQSTPPVINGTLSNQTVYGTRAFSFGFSTSTFYESDGDTLSYSAGSYQYLQVPGTEVDSPLPSWLTFYPNSLTFSGTPPQSAVGQTFNIYIQGTNPQGQFVKGYFSITVAQYVEPAPVYNGNLPNVNGVIGSSIAINLPSNAFVQPDGGALTYTGYVLIPEHQVDYWNSTHTDDILKDVPAHWVSLDAVGLAVNATTGQVTGTPLVLDYNYGDTGSIYYNLGTSSSPSYQIEIVATNAQGGAVSGTFTLSSSIPVPVVVGTLPTVTTSPGSGGVYPIPLNVFSDPSRTGMTYTVTAPSWMTITGTEISWSGVQPAGTYTVTIKATNAGGSTTTSFSVVVPEVAPQFSGGPYYFTATQGTGFAYQVPAATDYNGDGISYSASGIPGGVGFDPSSRTFSGTPSTAGTYYITVTATDSLGYAGSTTLVLTVNPPANQPPVYHGGLGTIVFTAGTTNYWSLPANTFTNPSGRALSYSFSGIGSGGIYGTWSMNSSTGQITATIPSNRNELNGSITITATDPADGLSVSVTLSVEIDGNGKGVPTLVATQAQAQVAPSPNVQSYWFTYDADNRAVVVDGVLQNGQVTIANNAGYANQYDAAGNVALVNTVRVNALTGTYTDTQKNTYDLRNELVMTATASGTITERKSYDADGHALLDASYYGDGSSGVVGGPSGEPDILNWTGWLAGAQLYTYNADGQLTAQATYNRYDSDWRDEAYQLQQRGQLPDETDLTAGAAPGATSDGPLQLGSVTQYTSFDHVGNVVTYTYSQPAQPKATSPQGVDGAGTPAYGANYTVNYLKKDGYLEQSTTGTPTVSGYVAATDTSYYDAFGRRLAVAQSSQLSTGTAQNTASVFAYDAAGEIVQRRVGSTSNGTFTVYGSFDVDHYSYAQGQQIGDVDEGGGIHTADTLTGFSSGDSTQSYTVQSGDTLESIAQSVYGNSDLAFVIGDANALTDGTLVVGQRITLPTVTTTSNTASTFKPYNPGQIIGSTTPSLPAAPPPPSSHHCNALAEIVVIAVTAIVTYYTAGATSGMLESELGTTGSAIASGAVAGAVGSVAGQTVAVSLGVQNGFSFGQVLTGAVGGGIGGGLASQFTASDSAFYSDVGNHISVGGNAIIGAASYTGAYAAEQVSGQAAHFSWAGLVSSAVGSAAGGTLGTTNNQAAAGINSGDFLSRVESNVAQDLVTRESSVALGDNHVMSWEQLGEDVFGNALGNAAIAGMNSPNAAQTVAQQGSGTDWNNALSTYNAEGASGWQEQNAAMSYALNSSSSVAAVNGGGDTGGDYLSLKASSIDDLYSAAQELKSTGAPQVSFSTMSTDQVESYVHDYSQLGIYQPDAQTLATVNVTPTAEDMAAAGLGNAGGGYEFGGTHGISDTEAFFTFNRAGQFLSGVGHQLKGLATNAVMFNPVTLPSMLPLATTRYTQAYNQGQLGNTMLQDAGGAIHGLVMSTPVGFIKALNEKDSMGGMERLGSSTVDAAMWVVPGAIEGLGGRAIPGGIPSKPLEFSGGTPALEGTPFSPDAVNARSAEFYALYGDNPLHGTMSNVEARQWYLAQDASIPESLDAYAPLEDQAKQAFDLRNANRTDTREYMSDRITADRLNREEPNRTWEQMIEYRRASGLSDQQIYQSIIDSSQKTRVSVNKQLGLE
ncbi:putative Ig domain-containing protein [Dyella sedimenti]|uniref:putative Ig domain-containing protein n=1 Tax=Dyella sedimenti TaxID=2919947 RepID=UPI00242D263F|nr:putative Ig domain-containing protein [Dyella sedimenti]